MQWYDEAASPSAPGSDPVPAGMAGKLAYGKWVFALVKLVRRHPGGYLVFSRVLQKMLTVLPICVLRQM